MAVARVLIAAHVPAVRPHQPEVIELSESGVNDMVGGDEEDEVQGGGGEGGDAQAGVEEQSIADRVMARRRVNFAEFGDVC